MEASAGFGTTRLFLADSRLAFALANHLRHQALHRAFGISREQSNVLTLILVASAADGAYEITRRIPGVHLGATGAAAGAIGLRNAVLGAAGPSSREVPRFTSLVALAVVGGLAVPGLRRAAHRMRLAEQTLRATEHRVRLNRIRRYREARDHTREAAA